uniref:Calcium uniporter protein n=1 Tax=Caenorhabditis tropicalis TaxID=1561998 RepID=A0A1I7T452_9PELO
MRNGRGLATSFLAAQRLANLRNTLWNRQNLAFSSSVASSSSPSIQESSQQLVVRFEYGLPLLDVPLPSRNEPCQFTMRPLSDTVGSLCDFLRQEDRGIDYVAVYGTNGVKLATCTSIEHLLQFGTFRLRLNDKFYEVTVPKTGTTPYDSSDKLRQLDDLRATVASLHAALCVDEYKLSREKKLLLQLENAETLLAPLHEAKQKIERECEAHTDRVMWAGFAAMGVQTGLFARLTWWEYSWDIMEPVTYFATYSTVCATFGYYLYTKQSFEYPSARERVYTKQFYRRAQKQNFDIERYNRLVNEVEDLRNQLKRMRDPLFQHLPVSYLSNLDIEK